MTEPIVYGGELVSPGILATRPYDHILDGFYQWHYMPDVSHDDLRFAVISGGEFLAEWTARGSSDKSIFWIGPRGTESKQSDIAVCLDHLKETHPGVVEWVLFHLDLFL